MRRHPEEHRPTEGTTRLETFCDGVFAIAITLLVLGIEVPDTTHGLGRALADQWYSYVAYGLSFLTIGIVWANHHEMFRLVARTTHMFLMINVVLLMFVALIPFPTQLVARYFGDPSQRRLVVLVYGGSGICLAIAFNAVWQYAVRRRLLYDDLDPHVIEKRTIRNYIGPVVYTLGTLLAIPSPEAGLAVFIMVALFYLIPTAH